MKIASRWGGNNSILDNGFLMLPNLLIDKQEELGITDDELVFIIKTMRHSTQYKLHDKQIDSSCCEKTLQRRRKSLADKGYLKFEVMKAVSNEGKYRTDGILYDYSGLTMALSQFPVDKRGIGEILDDDNEIEKPTGLSCLPVETQKSTLHNTTYNTIYYSEEDRDSLKKFEVDYFNRYGKEYKYTVEEKVLLSKASKQFIQSMPFIFEYSQQQKEIEKLPSTFVPRLVFFLKVDFRQNELIEFANERIEEIEQDKEMEKLQIIYRKERSAFESLLSEKNMTLQTFTQYLQQIKNRNFIYFKNGSITYDVLKDAKIILESMEI